MLPHLSMRLPAETNRVVQVKYTNHVRSLPGVERESMLLVRNKGVSCYQLLTPWQRSLSFSGSNQAREGRLVDALAVRGDEGRDTLR